MASNYPTSLDNFTNPTSNDSLNSPSHSLQHANINDAVEAIEAKLGIGASSAGSAVSGYVLTAGTGGTTTWAEPSQPGLTLITSGSISATASSISLSNVFTSTYKNYRLIFQGNDSAGNSEIRVRLRQNTTDYTSNLYSFGGLQVTSNAVRSDVYGNNISYFYCGFFTNLTSPVSDVSYVVMDINYSVPSNVKVNYQFWDAYFYRGGYGSGNARSMTDGNGLTIYSANGNNITGSWSLYGYK